MQGRMLAKWSHRMDGDRCGARGWRGHCCVLGFVHRDVDVAVGILVSTYAEAALRSDIRPVR